MANNITHIMVASMAKEITHLIVTSKVIEGDYSTNIGEYGVEEDYSTYGDEHSEAKGITHLTVRKLLTLLWRVWRRKLLT